jgi:hypothetical protein
MTKDIIIFIISQRTIHYSNTPPVTVMMPQLEEGEQELLIVVILIFKIEQIPLLMTPMKWSLRSPLLENNNLFQQLKWTVEKMLALSKISKL